MKEKAAGDKHGLELGGRTRIATILFLLLKEVRSHRFNELLEEFVKLGEEGESENLRRFMTLLETRVDVASAVRLVQVNEDDSGATVEEQVEIMRQRIITAGKGHEIASTGQTNAVNELTAATPPDDGDLGNMIDDIS